MAAVLRAVLAAALGATAALTAAAALAPTRSSRPAPGSPSADDPALLLASIRSDALMRTVEWLASPELQGRLAGSPEYARAAREAAERFRLWGLRPIDPTRAGAGPAEGALPRSDPARQAAPEDAGSTSSTRPEAFLQPIAIEYNRIEECALELVDADGATRPLELGRDFACRGLTGAAQVSAPVVFVGYGLSRPELGYDDYAGIDVNGKIVLAFKEPPPFRADSAGWGETWMPRPKGMAAAAHGAVALLLVSRPNQERPQGPIGSMLEGEAEHDAGFPRLQVAVEIGEELTRSAGLSLADLQARIDSARAPASRPLQMSARLDVRAAYERRRLSYNVVGILEGADPALKDDLVVVGAHLDHVGSQGAIYYPGANDNASGSAAVLAIAEAFATGGRRPRRSVAFCLWTSEEAGLLGTRHFVDHAPVPRDRIVTYLNFDCVGHGDSIQVGGGKSYPDLWESVREIDRAGARLMVGETWGGGGADATPFEEAGVPNLYFASRFSYTHLHLPSDRPETLNPRLLEAVARLGGGIAWKIAQGEAWANRGAREDPGVWPEE